MEQFNKEISGSSPIAGPVTITGDIPSESVFNLQGKTVTDLTIDLTGMSNGETMTLTNGSVTNLVIKDKSGVTLDLNSVKVTNLTTN